MKSEETKNLILAAVLSMAVIFSWQFFFAPPPEPLSPSGEGAEQLTLPDGQPVLPGTLPSQDGTPAVAQTRDGALTRTDRVEIDAPSVHGSLSLKGGRLDDLHLDDYRETLEPGSDTVTILSPTGGPHPYYATYGWLRTADGTPGPLPDANTLWQVEQGDKLTAETPVTLKWENGEGLIFRRTFTVDDKYMFSVAQSVENTGEAAVSVAPYGYIARRDLPDVQRFWLLHEGAVGAVDEETLVIETYDDMLDFDANPLEGGNVKSYQVTQNGWVGLTDKYWLTAMAPKPGQGFTAVYKSIQPQVSPEYRAEMRLPVVTVAPGESASVETYYFAGAKEYETLGDYQDDLGIVHFVDAIDWGWFYFLTKPLFTLLLWVKGIVGNMGFAIIGLTFLVKAVLFPLAYKSYVSMSKMKKLQPEVEKIKERVGDDRMKMQQEMMELYKKEKVNPASGCLPILLQIPIFFSLYKVLFVAIEMRHAPFIWWIHDLSAPDPTSFMNLFGLLPYEIPAALAFFSIGVFPILMGITMWMQQKLNPAPTDPTQAMIFAWMPWVFMFMLGTFASGLVIYWCANNILTFTQQYAIMRSQGVEVDFFGNVKKSFKRKKPAADGPKDGK